MTLGRRLLLSAAGDTFTEGPVNFSGAKIYRSTTQTPAGSPGPWTPITFDTVEFEVPAGGYWSAGNPTRISVPATGVYWFYFSATIATEDVGWACAFRKNSSGTHTSPQTSPNLERPIMHSHTVTNAGQIHCSTMLSLSSGDYVEAMVFLYTSAAIGISDQANYPEDSCTLLVEYIGA